MNHVKEVITYILSFKPYVLLPLLMLLFSIGFRMPIKKGISSALTIGIGFIGVFTFFDFFVQTIAPVVESLVARTGLHYNILDVGWTPLAAITWSYKLTPLLLLIVLGINVIMFFLKWTDTINVDIWNYWHFILIGAIVYETGHNIILAILSTLLSAALVTKLADWSAPAMKKFSKLPGICCTTLTAVSYYPVAALGDKLIDKIPFINKINADPESIKEKLGLLGEPPVIGVILGVFLGVGAGYDFKDTLEVSFKIAAVVHILPMMCGILGKGLVPISESIQKTLSDKYPEMKGKYIGLDIAVIMGTPSVVVTGLLLMPVAFILAFLLPGVGFIPIGDLPNIMGAVAMIVVATRGNIIRAFIISVPIIVGKLFIATAMAERYTELAKAAQYHLKGYDGIFTSFLDGGNILRYWIIKCFDGNVIAIASAAILLVGTFYWGFKKVKSDKLHTVSADTE
ncbi:MAG: gatC1 [Clostridia bacterium]|jgi:PTS system galactitol-specific IIC component|nr:gatC1 [Clostridia bacterium]